MKNPFKNTVWREIILLHTLSLSLSVALFLSVSFIKGIKGQREREIGALKEIRSDLKQGRIYSG